VKGERVRSEKEYSMYDERWAMFELDRRWTMGKSKRGLGVRLGSER
jgi:hypothetical protein